MLILTRKIGDTIVIGNKVFCTVLDQTRDGQLKLAFEAPEQIPINRFEIQIRIMQRMKEGNYENTLNCNETVIE